MMARHVGAGEACPKTNGGFHPSLQNAQIMHRRGRRSLPENNRADFIRLRGEKE